MKLTPMLQQYLRIKAEHRDAILLFRLGDFYEMFFEDAEVAAGILDIALTSRQRGEGVTPVPLCGVPYHAADPYIARLLAAGWKVAICEQREGTSRGLMDREVVRVVTQGTVLDESILEPNNPNYLAAVAATNDRCGLAVVEFSTGSLRVTELPSWPRLRAELERLRVRELVIPASLGDGERAQLDGGGWVLNDGPDPDKNVGGEEEWNARWPLAREAAARALAYLQVNCRGALGHLQPAEPYECDLYLTLDAAAQRNLELTSTLDGARRGSLLWVLDRTGTAMGARTLREWLLAPLVDAEAIGRRLDAVEELTQGVPLRAALRDALAGFGDFARIVGRIGAGSAGPRALRALANGLERVTSIRAALGAARAPLLVALSCDLDPVPEIGELIGRALVDDPPVRLHGGGIIRIDYHPEVDELRRVTHDGRGWITRLERRERERTGIGSLKIRYNKVFGYYIEVSKANLHLIPPDYQRKQTLVGAERFITPELKDYEARVLGAEERLRVLEVMLFEELVRHVIGHQRTMATTATALGHVDALVALAEVAHRRGYVRPHIRTETGITIKDGRHPVVEALAPSRETFVPNDCQLDPDAEQIVVITGPNMAGKSTYLRQTALIVLLAQMGSFVPASEATIGLVDRLFTRVGATDNLSGGESTFMVEMRETAGILAGATGRSLVVLDEIGRGTSTFDGISIAWAVVEFLHEHSTVRPLTLFATHYHELTELADACPRVRNASAAVREWNGEIIFLRRIVPGPANRSYGIDVARLAGVPSPVVRRAREILASLERGALVGGGVPRSGHDAANEPPAQSSLFEPVAVRLRRELAAVDVDGLTPLEALNYVGHLVEVARSGR